LVAAQRLNVRPFDRSTAQPLDRSTAPAMPAADFDWTLMRSFLAVIDHGSLLGAARALRGSQPTVGRHVAALERQLGTALFERTARGLVPTAAAGAVAEHARAMQHHADTIRRTVAGQREQATGTVRITASQTVACYLLPPILAALREVLPGIAIELVASNALSNLLRREADIAVRMVRPVQASLVARRIAQVDVGAWAATGYLQRHGRPRVPADLLAHRLLGFDTDDTIVRAFAARGVPLTREAFVLRSDDHVVLWQALVAGIGIGFAANWLAARTPQVQRVLPDLPIPVLPVWLTVHREIRSSRRIRAVYDVLAEQIPIALGA
jgi:DNA-binding transcriptional LysR family regulator